MTPIWLPRLLVLVGDPSMTGLVKFSSHDSSIAGPPRIHVTKATAQSDQLSTQMADLGHGMAEKPLDDDLSDASLAAEYGYYVELSSAKDIGDFKQKIDDAVKRLGFSEYAFVRLASSEDSGELISVTPELLDAYYKEGLYEYDLALQHASEHTRPIFRSAINEYVFQAPFNCEHTRCMREADELNKSFGYYDFYNVPAKAQNGNGHVLLSVTHRGMNPAELKRKVQECYSDLELLCDAIDFVSTRKFPGELLGDEKCEARVITINPRPLLVLDMLANSDLNITQVAGELGINVVTANRHLQAVRKAFGVRTNYAAIRQGILNKLIEYK